MPLKKNANKLQMCFLLLVVIGLGSAGCGQGGKSVENAQTAQTGRLENAVIPVEGMMCMACVSKVKRELGALDGVDSVKVHLEGKRASFTYDKGKTDIDAIRQAIHALGYDAGEPERRDKNDL